MATILQKTATDQCLVLGPRESLVYPFNFGTWAEIRVGGFFSYTSTGDNNSTGVFEVFSSNGGIANIFWGIKDSGNSLPFSAGSSFAGLTNDPSISPKTLLSNLYQPPLNGFQMSYASAVQSDNNPNPSIFITSGSSVQGKGLTDTSTDATLSMTTGIGVTGTAAYAMFNGLRFLYDSNAGKLSAATFPDLAYSNATSDVSTTNLQNKIAALNNQSSYITGAITPNVLPNAIFLYNPFQSNAIRVHSLGVYRYA